MVAAATVYGAAATSMAVVVKLTRTLMIIPISVGLALAQRRRQRRAAAQAAGIAVGLSTSFQALRAAGWRPLALGGIVWAAVAVSSLGPQGITGHL